MNLASEGISRKNQGVGYTNQGAESQIKRLTAELALEAAHLLLAGQRSDLSATLISALTAHNSRQRKENPRLEQRLALLTGQLAQKTEEVETVAAQNARHSSYLDFSIPRKTSLGDGPL